MSLDIVAAIDLKRQAERISKRHNVSTHEAFLMLQAGEDMTQLEFMTDIAEDEENEFEDSFYVESDNE
jgi:hypothetical protein